MKLIIIVSFLVALNCLNITEVTKKKLLIPKIKTTIPRDCFNIIDGKLKRVPCRIQSPFRTNFIKKKPVIYLYPEEPMDISVELKLKESKFTTVYPKFTKKNTWNVHAETDGTISIKGKKYPQLFWEAESYDLPDSNEGFVVTDKDAESFLEEKLDLLGLNEKEKTDFITFWLPVLLKNKLSLCTFQTKKFFDTMVLNVTPKPDSMIRIFLSIVKLDKPVNIKEQKLQSVERKGFTVVEWGGSNFE